MNLDYCDAQHTNSPNGCYEYKGHTGEHKGYKPWASEPFYWGVEGSAPAVPEGSAALVLTREELGILITLLAPVKQFFPVLEAKLEAAQE